MKKYIYSYGLQTTVCNDGLEIILSSQIIVVWRSNEKCACKSKPIDNFSNFCEVFWLLWKVFHAVAEEVFLKWQKNRWLSDVQNGSSSSFFAIFMHSRLRE